MSDITDGIPVKKWIKKRVPSTWRNVKIAVHKTVNGKGVVGRLINA